MKKEGRLARFLKFFHEQLFKINDSPQRVALGIGVGVFAGIIPGTGPLASLFLALILRVNRAAALLGSMLTNTWISFLTFILAVKIGSAILGVSWQETRSQAAEILQKFTWSSFFKLSGLKLFAPVLIGYLVVSLTLGLLAYLVTLVTIWIIKRRAICR